MRKRWFIIIIVALATLTGVISPEKSLELFSTFVITDASASPEKPSIALPHGEPSVVGSTVEALRPSCFHSRKHRYGDFHPFYQDECGCFLPLSPPVKHAVFLA